MIVPCRILLCLELAALNRIDVGFLSRHGTAVCLRAHWLSYACQLAADHSLPPIHIERVCGVSSFSCDVFSCDVVWLLYVRHTTGALDGGLSRGLSRVPPSTYFIMTCSSLLFECGAHMHAYLHGDFRRDSCSFVHIALSPFPASTCNVGRFGFDVLFSCQEP